MISRIMLAICLMSNAVTYSSSPKPPKREPCSLSKVLKGAVVAFASLFTLNTISTISKYDPLNAFEKSLAQLNFENSERALLKRFNAQSLANVNPGIVKYDQNGKMTAMESLVWVAKYFISQIYLLTKMVSGWDLQ